MLDAALEEAHRAEDVHPGVEVRLPDRAPDVYLGGLVAQDLGSEPPEDLREVPPGEDIDLVEARPLGEVLALAGGEVVDDGHLVAAGDEGVDDVGADEAGSACHEGTHGEGMYALGRRTPPAPVSSAGCPASS